MSKKHYIVPDSNANERIDKLLVQKNSSCSRNQVQSWIANRFVSVNGQNVKSNYRCQIGDEITWSIPEEKQLILEGEDIPLDIVYEDDFLLVVNKPKGMVIHPTTAHPTGTLVHALLNHTNKLSQIGGEERPGIVHRIDKDTSGLLVVAKDNETHQALTDQFFHGECERIYEALVHGVIGHETGIIDAPIARDPSIRTKMAVVTGGKEAITHFHVITRYDHCTNVECELKTGRTHQIRVHMNYIGHSVIGDRVYRGHQTLNIDGQALFAKTLSFTHPHTNEKVRFEIEIPTYFEKIIAKIER